MATVSVTAVVVSITCVPANAAGGPGDATTKVSCGQGGPGCSLSAGSRQVIHRRSGDSGRSGPAQGDRSQASKSGPGPGLAGLARRFAQDAGACTALGALAQPCIAARYAGLFGPGGAPAADAGDAGGGEKVRVDPVVIARRAAARLRLSEPTIRSSPAPGVKQLVGVPTWLWIDRSSWSPRSATVSVPGVSVTARATPQQVRWGMGDGSAVECSGPGTMWRPGGEPERASPDCGHTYRRSSAGQPEGAFRVTARVAWSVTWSGAGQTGKLPGLSTRAHTRMRVAESQAITR